MTSSDWEYEDYGDLAHLSAADAYAIEPDERAELRKLPYPDYLRTAHWSHTRRRALLRAGRQCQRCEISDVQLEVHHLTYDRLGRESEGDLIVLCRRCHGREHGDTEDRCPHCLKAVNAELSRLYRGRCWYCGKPQA
jgi:hypothetical protein